MSLPSTYKAFYINGLNGTKIEVIIGDMFNEKCDLVIPTNTCFDVDSQSIKSNSVQGIFCRKYYKGDTGLLDSDIKLLLEDFKENTSILEDKKIGKNIRYPINTIITLNLDRSADSQNFHWLAINHFDNKSGVIYDSVNIKKSIDALWKYLKVNHSKLRDLCLPMIGTGLARVNQPLPDLAEYYIDSFIINSKDNNIVKTLKIYLYPNNDNIFEDYNYIINYLEYRSKNTHNIEKKYI